MCVNSNCDFGSDDKPRDKKAKNANKYSCVVYLSLFFSFSDKMNYSIERMTPSSYCQLGSGAAVSSKSNDR